jgi:hypothetical protein
MSTYDPSDPLLTPAALHQGVQTGRLWHTRACSKCHGLSNQHIVLTGHPCAHCFSNCPARCATLCCARRMSMCAALLTPRALRRGVQVVVGVVLIQNNARCWEAIQSMATARAAAAAGGGGVEPVIGEFSVGCCSCHRWGQRPLNIAAACSSAGAAAGRAARDWLMAMRRAHWLLDWNLALVLCCIGCQTTLLVQPALACTSIAAS